MIALKEKTLRSSTLFRLYKTEYSRIGSTIFDLITDSGNNTRETKQTKGLGYIISAYPNIIKEIISNEKIKDKIHDREVILWNIKQSDLIVVDAEMYSIDKLFRRDISISYFRKNQKQLLIIIEGKSIKNRNKIFEDIEYKMDEYFSPQNYPSDSGILGLGIVLTRYKRFFKNKSYISVTWSEIIEILYRIVKNNKLDSYCKILLQDYLKFISGVEQDMNFYEKEVLSIPAKNTIESIKKYHIYDCPDTAYYKYALPLYVTFRIKDGKMERLYKVEDVVTLNLDNNSLEEMLGGYQYKERLLNYINERESLFERKYGTYKFYILSENELIELEHKPKPKRKTNKLGNVQQQCYFKLADLINGDKEVEYEVKN